MATGLAAVMGAYLFGGIPIGLLIARLNAIADIRQHGSGNIGASNVLRLLGVKLGLLVLLLDALKGYAPVAAAKHVFGLQGWWVAGVALAAIGGHCFSVYLRLTGGKGVATSLGVILGLDWRAGLICLGVWVAIVATTRYISLASMIASALSAPMLWFFGEPGQRAPAVMAGGLLAALVIERHRANIKRLLAGNERRLGQRETAAAEERP
jgi:glycerol-3-phosphate acyltransferase PlsY